MPHIFLTGQPGVGKTTLIHRVLQQLAATHSLGSAQGFWTEEVRGNEGRVGFDVVTVGEPPKRAALSRLGNPSRASCCSG